MFPGIGEFELCVLHDVAHAHSVKHAYARHRTRRCSSYAAARRTVRQFRCHSHAGVQEIPSFPRESVSD